jgi:hypothetical protein
MAVCILVVFAPAALAARNSLLLGRVHCRAPYRVATVDGHVAHLYCGTARASVDVGEGNMHTFAGGACFKKGGLYSVEIGKLVVGDESSAPYFGLEFSGQAGKDPSVTVTFVGGEWLGIGIKLKLTGGTTRGTFTGKDILSGAKLSGSFRC